jgi:hypothetical protein
MKKFNNILDGTDCGDAGLPAGWRFVPKTPDAGSVVIQFLERRDRCGARAGVPGEYQGVALCKSTDVGTSNGPDTGIDNVVRLGVNYKFDQLGPIVAKF